MFIKTTCPNCGKSLKIKKDTLPANKTKIPIKCPACNKVFILDISKYTEETDNETDKTQVDYSFEQDPNKTIISDGFSGNSKCILLNKNTGDKIVLRPGINILGRKRGESMHIIKGANFIIFDDNYISKIHCIIDVRMKGNEIKEVILTDNGQAHPERVPSRNGTFHVGNRLDTFDEIVLANNDTLVIGHTELVVKLF